MTTTAHHKATMHAQGNGWIVSTWRDDVEMYEQSHEMSYAQARSRVGRANCPGAHGGKCRTPEVHAHHEEA